MLTEKRMPGESNKDFTMRGGPGNGRLIQYAHSINVLI